MNGRKLNRQAAEDAAEYVRAKMYYGEGAGIRRRLIDATVSQKMYTVPGYEEAFDKAYAQQDMAEHAELARKERIRVDRAKKIDRNVRGLLHGNRQSLTTGVAVAATIAYYAHQTGYDKVALEYSKKKYQKMRHTVAEWNNARKDAKK